MDNDKDIKPNNEARLQSAILSLRNTYCKYRKKMITYFRNSGYDSNGNFYVLGDKDKLNRDIMELSNKIQRLNGIIDTLKKDIEEESNKDNNNE